MGLHSPSAARIPFSPMTCRFLVLLISQLTSVLDCPPDILPPIAHASLGMKIACNLAGAATTVLTWNPALPSETITVEATWPIRALCMLGQTEGGVKPASRVQPRITVPLSSCGDQTVWSMYSDTRNVVLLNTHT